MSQVHPLEQRFSRIRRSRAVIAAGIVVLGTALAGTPGCKPQRPPEYADTAVGQGERFQTGTPVYDEYFRTIHELHSSLATAELEERDARTTLATMLYLLPTAPADQVLRKLRERTEELPPMRLDLEASEDGDEVETARVELVGAARPDDDSKNLMMVLEATANADLALAARMAALPERCHRMHSVGKALMEDIPKAFSGESPSRRERIRRELEASLEVLVVVANGSREVERRVRAFVAEIQDALKATEDNATSTEAPLGSGAAAPTAPAPEPKMPEDFNP